jgi:hypothetical protein
MMASSATTAVDVPTTELIANDVGYELVVFNLRGHRFPVPKHALRAYPDSLLATLVYPTTGGDTDIDIAPTAVREDGIAEYYFDRDPSFFLTILNLHYQRLTVTDDALEASLDGCNHVLSRRPSYGDKDFWSAFKEELEFYNVFAGSRPRLPSSDAFIQVQKVLAPVVEDICAQLRDVLFGSTYAAETIWSSAYQEHREHHSGAENEIVHELSVGFLKNYEDRGRERPRINASARPVRVVLIGRPHRSSS